MKFEQKVLAGASYLDLAQPGWAEKIDTSDFDMGNSTHCVIGQTMGNYIPGIEQLHISGDQANALGFNTADSADYEALTAAWIPEIEKRQPKAPSRYEIESGGVKYVLDGEQPNPTLTRDVGYGDESRLLIGTVSTRVYREIGEAFIDLADQREGA